MTHLPQWYAELAVRQPDLFRMIGDFNTKPQHWAHPERLAALPHGDVLAILDTSVTGQRHAARWVTGQLGLSQVPAWWDFTPARRRLILINWLTLEKLACYCGAAIHASKIAATIARAQTIELKSAIGAAAHAFALRRGRLVNVPDLPQLQAPGGAGLGRQVLDSGWAAVLGLLSDEPAELLRRFWVKLPPAMAQDRMPKLAAEECEQVWNFVRRVGREVFSKEEEACFA